MAKITIYGDYADFEAPVYMTDNQLDKFILFLENMYGTKIQTKDIIEKSREPIEHEDQKKWTPYEILALFGSEDNISLARKLNRKEMSVRMKRGIFMADFVSWARKKGYALPPTKKMIQEFLDQR